MENKKIITVKAKTKSRIRLIAAMLAMAFCLVSCGSKEAVVLESEELVLEEEMPESTEEDQVTVQETAEEKQMEQSNLFVHICGEVAEPGVYELSGKSRIYEAVEAAGGFTAAADESYVNLAQPLEDGMKIRIPAVGEEMPETGNAAGAGDGEDNGAGMADGLVDINRASRQELCTLPGIGESRADSIIAYREQNGAFTCIEDIMKVDGIKEGMFAKMKDKISVKNP